MRKYDDSSDSGTSDSVELSIAKVRAAILASDIRAASKSRTNYASRSAQNKTYKPNGVVFKGPANTRTSSNFTYGAGNPAAKNPRANEYRAGERGQGVMKPTSSNFKYTAPTASKPKAKSSGSSTSFKKGGVAGVLKSPEAKKFRDTFKKKGLLPALRGK
jgi:hypothetical protein